MTNVVLLPGDGIGPEVTDEAAKLLLFVGKKCGLDINTSEFPIGGASLDTNGVPILESTIETCKNADAVFLGAVGGPNWDHMPKEKKPETGLLQLRKELQLFTNLRPVKVYPCLMNASTLKKEVLEGVDVLVVRELTSGIYFGEPRYIKTDNNEEYAVDTMLYRAHEIQRIARVAFQAAQSRNKKVISVDKANVLMASQLWRKIATDVADEFPDVHLDHMLVDNCAMQLIRNPKQFDVLLTGNMFGDILSDEASMLAGSLGMLPSASLGLKTGLFEPAHGSAPDIAGQQKANPLAAMASIALMFRYSFQLENAAKAIEDAITTVLNDGYRTLDLSEKNTTTVSTSEMGDLVLHAVEKQLTDKKK